MFQQDSKICPSCRHLNNANDNYCGNCGIEFTENRGNTVTTLKEEVSVVSNVSSKFTSLSFISNKTRILLLIMLLLVIGGTFFFGINVGKATYPNIARSTATPTSVIKTFSVCK